MAGKVQTPKPPKTSNVAAKRHQQHQKPSIEGIKKGDIRRLARKGGVRRISLPVYDHSKHVMRAFLRNLLKSAVIYSTACKRKTVTGMDVTMAMKKQGMTLYGAV